MHAARCLASLILLASATPAFALAAQPNVAGRELVGIVRDSAGAPIEGAIVEIPGVTARTNARGTFQLWTMDLDTLTISIRRLGFTAVSALIASRNFRWDTVVVEMDRLPQRLAAAAIREAQSIRRLGLRDFTQRKEQGLGEYVTRSEIIARNTSRTSDVVRDLRGVRLVRLRSGGYGVRFAAFAARDPNCTPMMWLDGQRAPGLEIDDITANDIEAIELYENWTSTPHPFSAGSSLPCGTIVVWTRVPGS